MIVHSFTDGLLLVLTAFVFGFGFAAGSKVFTRLLG